jgi:hypothetical protein
MLRRNLTSLILGGLYFCWVDVAVTDEKECVSYMERFEGNFPVRVMKGREGTGIFKSVWPLSEKNSWRYSGGHMRTINLIFMDVGINSEVVLPLEEKTVLFLKNNC